MPIAGEVYSPIPTANYEKRNIMACEHLTMNYSTFCQKPNDPLQEPMFFGECGTLRPAKI